jgi:HEPN domain-containing protein
MKPEEDPSNPMVWLARARSNFNLAEAGQHIRGVFLEDLCFDAQQAAEKALKAICIHLELDFPKAHSLTILMGIIKSGGVPIPDAVREAAILTQYAVRTRYPGAIEPIGLEEYQAALVLASRVLAWAEKVVEGGTA